MPVLRKIEHEVSAFDSTSLVAGINRGVTDSVSEIFADIFRESKRINKLSGEMFDPTVMPLVNLWGFGYTRCSDLRPDTGIIRKALQSVGIGDCRIDDHMRLHRKSPATQFDFSAIAKGYAVDCLARMLKRNGCSDFMVEIGGELIVMGKNPEGKNWKIRIENPDSSLGPDGGLKVLQLTDCAVATSGNYHRVRTLADGSRVAHTISPITGEPVMTRTLSATVIVPVLPKNSSSAVSPFPCMTADALATACLAMPPVAAHKMLSALPGVRSYIALSDSSISKRNINFGD